ncbi:uncharacterized protein LOC122243285 [Penaeus japonicus]|uniref:uncharacterized protein LOC122243285 n=1 Tax=Penaeus japonicus TaxID=27405 RepID=UPI001C70BCF2|nr:uncharacterized protein LOC122243285 [Penaeus japonicus]
MRGIARGLSRGPPRLMLATAFVLLVSSVQFSERSSSAEDLTAGLKRSNVSAAEKSDRLAERKSDILPMDRNSSFIFAHASDALSTGSERRKSLNSGPMQRQRRFFKTGNVTQSCFDSYRQVHNNRLPPKPVMHYMGRGMSLKIFHQRDFVDVCLPLFRKYGMCKEERYFTFCLEDLTLFLHTRWCERPSEEDKYFEVLWAVSLMKYDYECFNHICDGSYRVVVRNVSDIAVQIIRLDQGHLGKACWHLYRDQELRAAIRDKFNMTIIWTVNMFFPCCYSNFRVTWMGLPEEKGLNRFWDYLPLSCRVGEIALAVSVACIGVTGLVGNLLVLTVILRSNHRGEESSILRTSLAFADLLTSSFVVIPAFYDHLLPILGHLDLDENSATLYSQMPTTAEVPFQHLQVVTSGYHLFQGLVLGVCSIVSLLTLFLLSVERFILMGRVHRYQQYFTVPRVKIAVFLTWSMAAIDTLFYMYDGDGSFSVTWSSFSKLPISTSFKKIGGVLRWTYSFHVFVLALICVLTVVTSLVSIGTFVKEQAKVVASWKERNMRVSGPYQKENRQILVTMCILTFLFVLSTVPSGSFIVVNLTDTFLVQEALIRYLGWWTFLSGCSWNPWIYNMRSRQFRQEVVEILRAMVPLWLRRKMQRPEAVARQQERRMAQMRMLKKLNLTDWNLRQELQ